MAQAGNFISYIEITVYLSYAVLLRLVVGDKGPLMVSCDAHFNSECAVRTMAVLCVAVCTFRPSCHQVVYTPCNV